MLFQSRYIHQTSCINVSLYIILYIICLVEASTMELLLSSRSLLFHSLQCCPSGTLTFNDVLCILFPFDELPISFGTTGAVFNGTGSISHFKTPFHGLGSYIFLYILQVLVLYNKIKWQIFVWLGNNWIIIIAITSTITITITTLNSIRWGWLNGFQLSHHLYLWLFL